MKFNVGGGFFPGEKPKPTEKEPFNPVLKPEDVKRLFRTEQDEKREELKEKGPIFYTTKTEKVGEEEIEKEYVSVVGIELPVNKEGVGSLFRGEEFKDFSLDKKSLELLKIYAQAIKLNQPVLVEGETDIGKTKTLEYLSFLTNTRLKRISFSGQTDVTEFIGKYVPNIESAQRLFEKTLENRSRLNERSLEIIAKAEQEQRGLTESESKEIAQVEGIHLENVNWVWQDGMIPQAMEGNNGKGVWLYFDELGAAEPSVLVKTNRIFERYGRLELSENGGRLVEAGPEFRIVASTNPPEYAGREPFAPDYVRRFVYQKVGPLDADTLKERTAYIFRQKSAEPSPESYHVSTETPINLTENPEVSEILENALVEFHTAALKQLEAGLAKDQNQQFRYEFSDIIRVRDYLIKLQEPDLLKTLKDAVEFYYVNKLGTDDAREKLREVFETTLRLHRTEEKLKKAVRSIKQGQPALAEKKEEAKAPSLEDDFEHLSPGHYNVTFNEAPDSMGRPGFICKVPNRKTIILDRNSIIKPERGKEYHVRVVKETHPGLHMGVYFVEIIEESKKQKLIEELKTQGYEFMTNSDAYKLDQAGNRVLRSDEEVIKEIKSGMAPNDTGEYVVKRIASDLYGNPIPAMISVWRKG